MPSKNLNDDRFYEKLGVEPPKSDSHYTEEQLERLFEQQAQRQGHIWQQRGSRVTCTSCPFEHAFNVPTDMILQGTDEKGMPILKKLDKHNL